MLLAGHSRTLLPLTDTGNYAKARDRLGGTGKKQEQAPLETALHLFVPEQLHGNNVDTSKTQVRATANWKLPL